MTYPMTTGRNFDEIMRVVVSIQRTDKHKVATAANWTEGQNVIVNPGMDTGEAETKFGPVTSVPLPSANAGKKDYLRYVKDPGLNDDK